jgi:predicted nucleic acid-binding protein
LAGERGRISWPGSDRVDALIDTGAILAILDRADRWHRACLDAVASIRLPALTSQAVLTELFYMSAHLGIGIEPAWNLVRSGALRVASIGHEELAEIHELMRRYADRPMDFADATLVYLARRESLSTILTVDHADFSTYRIEGKRAFRILPVGRP